mmetsp:Transcript_33260/g.83588  ORF Transcript_33260/g.83588 Transcript_33260/m.83588 type:complete len:356 (+) Transcript_33260:263-1330(+)
MAVVLVGDRIRSLPAHRRSSFDSQADLAHSRAALLGMRACAAHHICAHPHGAPHPAGDVPAAAAHRAAQECQAVPLPLPQARRAQAAPEAEDGHCPVLHGVGQGCDRVGLGVRQRGMEERPALAVLRPPVHPGEDGALPEAHGRGRGDAADVRVTQGRPAAPRRRGAQRAVQPHVHRQQGGGGELHLLRVQRAQKHRARAPRPRPCQARAVAGGASDIFPGNAARVWAVCADAVGRDHAGHQPPGRHQDAARAQAAAEHYFGLVCRVHGGGPCGHRVGRGAAAAVLALVHQPQLFQGGGLAHSCVAEDEAPGHPRVPPGCGCAGRHNPRQHRGHHIQGSVPEDGAYHQYFVDAPE